MGESTLRRELTPTELPENADESLPLATTMERQPPGSTPNAGGEEHRAGDEQEEPTPTQKAPDAAPVRQEPPRGKASGGA